MSGATIVLGANSAISFQSINADGTGIVRQGVMLSIDGKIAGDIMNCVFIPATYLGAVIKSLELLQTQMKERS
jgi:hypothetical protein